MRVFSPNRSIHPHVPSSRSMKPKIHNTHACAHAQANLVAPSAPISGCHSLPRVAPAHCNERRTCHRAKRAPANTSLDCGKVVPHISPRKGCIATTNTNTNPTAQPKTARFFF
ncbi:hypothetical protein E2C01_100126 [Portunus trituberculatus]|uniref:Uncharacterized protein n=1 Tax=Portunus trituberculatus TaxID=210409 RepID=A0A5B7KGL5_PORTR|nr:hypothetical protein [Portunus trituberculatus]